MSRDFGIRSLPFVLQLCAPYLRVYNIMKVNEAEMQIVRTARRCRFRWLMVLLSRRKQCDNNFITPDEQVMSLRKSSPSVLSRLPRFSSYYRIKYNCNRQHTLYCSYICIIYLFCCCYNMVDSNITNYDYYDYYD